MKTRHAKRNSKNEGGFITLDFIFALVMGIGFGIVFFVISFTLSAVEVAQYMAYSTARTYNGAHETETLQKQLAQKKFAELMETGAFKGLFKNDYFTLGQPTIKDFSDDYPETDPDNRIFVGVQLPFKSNILNLKLPVVGSTSSGDSAIGQATLNAYLMREVSSQECRENFNKKRFQQLQSLSGTPYGQAKADASKYYLITDNGC